MVGRVATYALCVELTIIRTGRAMPGTRGLWIFAWSVDSGMRSSGAWLSDMSGVDKNPSDWRSFVEMW